MATPKKKVLEALAEVELGLETRAVIAKKYGVSKKTLWKWGKNPPGSARITNTELKRAVPRLNPEDESFDLVDNPLTTDNLEPINIPEGADSLLVDQLADSKHRDFLHQLIETRNPGMAYAKVYHHANKEEATWKGHMLLRSRSIRRAYQQLNLLQIKTFESQVLPTCIEHLMDIVTMDVTEYFEESGDLKPFKSLSLRQRRLIHKVEKKVKVFRTGTDEQGMGIWDAAEQNKVETPEKLKAIELLGKIAGMWLDTNVSINMTQNNTNITKQKSEEGMSILENITKGLDPYSTEVKQAGEQ